MNPKCVALEWDMTDQGRKDYTPCDETNTEACILEGVLLAVDVHLCREHQKYFCSSPPGWGMVKLFDKESGHRIEFFPYRGRSLMAEQFAGERGVEPDTQ